MKKIPRFLALDVLLLSLATSAPASVATGFVLCDANQDLTFDTNDVGIANVRVVIINENHTFTNSTITAADGSFSVQIPNFDPLAERRDPLSQVYEETLDPATLPTNSTTLFPLPITYLSPTPTFYIDFDADLTNLVYTSATGTFTNGNWLVKNPDCVSGDCRLVGAGIIGRLNRPGHIFGGIICSGSVEGGQWLDLQPSLNQEFRSTEIRSAQCGEVTPSALETPFKWLEFTGNGTLKGPGRNQANFNPVQFIARVEDYGRPGKEWDRYYLRVYTSDGITRLLISGDPSNPTNIVTMPISSGNMRIQGP